MQHGIEAKLCLLLCVCVCVFSYRCIHEVQGKCWIFSLFFFLSYIQKPKQRINHAFMVCESKTSRMQIGFTDNKQLVEV